MMKHLEDGGDLSVFVDNEGQVGIVCSRGHQWLLTATPAMAIESDGTAIQVDDVLAIASEHYPDAFGNSE